MNVNRRPAGRYASILLTLIVLLLMQGCYYYPTREAMLNTLSFRNTIPGHHLRKKIGIALFENRTLYTNAAAIDIFTEYFVENLRERCPKLLFISPGQTDMAKLLADPPRLESGRLDNAQLAQVGRALGLNAIIAVALTSISPSQEERGLLFFKDMHFFLEVEALVKMFDTETASILLQKSIRKEVEVDQQDVTVADREKAIANYLMEEALDDISSKMIKLICSSASDQPWKGYVMSIDKDRVMITSGLDVGLKVGERLFVYDSNQVIDGTGGHRYFVPGKQTGQLEITGVGENNSEAQILSGQVLRPGSLVMLGK